MTRQATSSTTRPRHKLHLILTGLFLFLAGLVLVVLLLALLPIRVNNPAVSRPAQSYDEAAARVEAIRQSEAASGAINPVCYSNLIDHGQKTEKVIIFFHGFTSCPEQFRELGQIFHDAGYTIYIPRLPHHGQADVLSEELKQLRAEELAALATESIDIALGLGDEVIAAGLSGGGTLAAWIGQNEADVNHVVTVAPLLGIGSVPDPVNRPLTRLLTLIPSIWMWWDSETKAANPESPFYAYPRYPSRAAGEFLRLGFATQDAARRNEPAAEVITVITNANDTSVSNGLITQLTDLWEARSRESLRTYEFERVLELPHDMITPTREDGNPGLVYPVILEQITNR